MRHGTLWLARRSDGAWLVERRPDRGLLGGMLGFPGSDWDGAGGPEPIAADWQDVGEVRHTFTHFHLTLTVHVAQTQNLPHRGQFEHNFDPTHLPTLMRTAWDAAQPLL